MTDSTRRAEREWLARQVAKLTTTMSPDEVAAFEPRPPAPVVVVQQRGLAERGDAAGKQTRPTKGKSCTKK